MASGSLKKETEGFLMATQDQTLRTNVIKVNRKMQQVGKPEYKKRHGNVVGIVHWSPCEKYDDYGLPRSEQWYPPYN